MVADFPFFEVHEGKERGPFCKRGGKKSFESQPTGIVNYAGLMEKMGFER
jgi:hypothetical protein